ncbi:3-deoxy-manno-octulosonate cytidylyltransferase [Methylomonas sp. MS20]|uniref:3-deoxy-manno-octulosonate cytidylyltransferase n=1 Tax=unclassified Methylomonas TaxID=2608980 RepID=UPI0028A508A7|nr:3-deoxy-manno-octulosonate cytidylyltransferase [Methylomonas sp. MV1]MDT4331175.1 3-deoxy-manno-octulosonate cytidylyltransferase [Methylomonas sp. MV1]
MTAFKVVIPARYASTRLPGKPLLDIAGKPMIAHVCERALEADAEQVVVATDDSRIFDTVSALGIQTVMTDPNHQSGTERIAEVAEKLGWRDGDIVVNLQGDEPLIPPACVRDAAKALAGQSQAGIATLAAKIEDGDEVFNPNAVKVVLDQYGYALYFSRAPIPWHRASFPDCRDTAGLNMPYLRHIGLYAYTVGFLKRYCGWSPSPLESVEALEQLRILWHGEKVLVKIIDRIPEAGVDTEEDLRRVAARLARA